jgi:hypothetical protein
MSLDVITSTKKFPKALKDGKVKIGNITIDCAVLENGTRVVTQKSILSIMGRTHPGGRPTKAIIDLKNQGVQIPVFVAANNLIPFIPSRLRAQGTPIIFIPIKGSRAYGYDAEIISDICDTYIDAFCAGKLTKDQIPIAATLRIISKGLQIVGIHGLINEACGIITSEKDYLQRILSTYINKTLLKWCKRFPDHFFEKYKIMYGLRKEDRIPSHVGCFINKNIYNELAPGVLDELRKLNPKDVNGKRAHTHHQLLTPEKGIIELDKQLIKVSAIMSFSESRKDFEQKYKKVKEMENAR